MFAVRAFLADRFPPARKESTMRGLRSLLGSTPSRIGRRLVQIVAIAAASLRSAGV
jgi:hypothetical protein